MGAYLDAIDQFQYTLLPFPSELLYLGLGYEEGRELPHQSANCAPINEGDYISTNPVYILANQNHVLINTLSATGTTSTTTHSTPDIRKIKQPSSSVQMQSWNILLVRHFSQYAQEWLGFIHCLGYIQQSLGLITMMFQWYLR